MDGIHDLGGMHGFGPVRREASEPKFHARWERRVFGLLNLTLAAGIGNVDQFRHAIERMEPVDYLTAGYYGRWLHAVESLVTENGVATAAELEARRIALAQGAASISSSPSSPMKPPLGRRPMRRAVTVAPRFELGERVLARNVHPAGHTRLPRYVRGKRGVVVEIHPAFVFPDTNAHGQGERPQHLYGVRFDGAELWGPDAEPGVSVAVDLFEDYLDPVEVAG